MLAIFWLYLTYTLIKFFTSDDIFERMFQKVSLCQICCGKPTDTQVDQSEDLDFYFKHLDDDDRNWSIKEEENNREMLHMECMLETTMNMMKTTRIGKRGLQGIHTYDILRNPKYVQKFQYVSPSIPNREQYIKDGDDDDFDNGFQSDLVRRVLNLAFIRYDDLKKLNFGQDSIN